LNTTSKTFGYARVSTQTQSTDNQEHLLNEHGCDKVFVEKYTGTKSDRPQLNELRAQLRHGDTVVVTKLDRLGRSTKDLLEIISDFNEMEVNLVVTQQNIDTTTIEGRLFFTLISAFAQFEAEIISARTKDGLAAAKAKGKTGGRKPNLNALQKNQVRKLYEEGSSVTHIAQIFGTTRQCIYRTLNQSSSGSTSGASISPV
jgi:DNA invertase Pin-like site-specific DNA recombinase